MEVVILHRFILFVNVLNLELLMGSVGVEALLFEEAWVIGEQILSVSEGVLFASDAHSVLAWQLVPERPPISYLTKS